jgi:hypothetical protein
MDETLHLKMEDITKHLPGRRRKHSDLKEILKDDGTGSGQMTADLTKKSLFWKSEIEIDTKELDRLFRKWTKACKAQLTNTDPARKETLKKEMIAAKKAWKGQQHMIKTLQNGSMADADLSEVGGANIQNVEHLGIVKTNRLIQQHKADTDVLTLHKLKVDLEKVWSDDVDQKILTSIVSIILNSDERMEREERQKQQALELRKYRNKGNNQGYAFKTDPRGINRPETSNYLRGEATNEQVEAAKLKTETETEDKLYRTKICALIIKELTSFAGVGSLSKTQAMVDLAATEEQLEIAKRNIAKLTTVVNEGSEKFPDMEKLGFQTIERIDRRSLFAKLHYNNRMQYKL